MLINTFVQWQRQKKPAVKVNSNDVADIFFLSLFKEISREV